MLAIVLFYCRGAQRGGGYRNKQLCSQTCAPAVRTLVREIFIKANARRR